MQRSVSWPKDQKKKKDTSIKCIEITCSFVSPTNLTRLKTERGKESFRNKCQIKQVKTLKSLENFKILETNFKMMTKVNKSLGSILLRSTLTNQGDIDQGELCHCKKVRQGRN